MKVILLIVGGLAFALGIFLVFASKSAANDVAAVLVMLVGIVALGFGAVVTAIEQSNEQLVSALARQSEAATPRAPVAVPTSAPVTPDPSNELAKTLLKQAEDQHFASKFDDARATYAAVVERFPGSKQAATAKQQLDNLRNA
ncbi:MAG TPA: hypothetical protein VF403_23425 [Kofleriaceae bacterium]